jgi:hypothetical protein
MYSEETLKKLNNISSDNIKTSMGMPRYIKNERTWTQQQDFKR